MFLHLRLGSSCILKCLLLRKGILPKPSLCHNFKAVHLTNNFSEATSVLLNNNFEGRGEELLSEFDLIDLVKKIDFNYIKAQGHVSNLSISADLGNKCSLEKVFLPKVAMETSLNLFKRLCPLLLECKCKALVAINVSGRHERANYFIIVTTLSARHSRKVIEEIKKLWQELSSDKNSFVVDENDLNWCILQIEGVQVHLLDAPTRQRLELEKLWVLGKYDDQLCDMMTNHVKLMPRGKRRMRIKYIFNESEQ